MQEARDKRQEARGKKKEGCTKSLMLSISFLRIPPCNKRASNISARKGYVSGER
jgi:hypothetical protein